MNGGDSGSEGGEGASRDCIGDAVWDAVSCRWHETFERRFDGSGTPVSCDWHDTSGVRVLCGCEKFFSPKNDFLAARERRQGLGERETPIREGGVQGEEE